MENGSGEGIALLVLSRARFFILFSIAAFLCALCVVLFFFSTYLTVEHEGTGVSTPPPGRYRYSAKQTPRLRASPAADSGHGFVGWRGAVESADYEIELAMTRNQRVTAVFSDTPGEGARFSAVTIAVAGLGRGSVSPDIGRYLYRTGEVVYLLARPAPGYYFGGWRLAGNAPEPDDAAGESFFSYPEHVLCVDSDRTATAWFERDGYRLTLEQKGAGRLSLPPGDYAFARDMRFVVFPHHAEGWRLRHWEDGAGRVAHVPETVADLGLSIEMTRDQVYCAVFEEAQRTLTLIEQCEGKAAGTTVPPASSAGVHHVLPFGESVRLTATPSDADSAFGGWSGDLPEGVAHDSSLSPEITIPMNEDRSITARFVETEITLALEALVDGVADERTTPLLSLAPGHHGFMNSAEIIVSLEVVLVPDCPIAFVRWAGDLPADADPTAFSLSLPMTRDRRITAQFTSKDMHKVTIGHTGAGAGRSLPTPGTYAVAAGRPLRVEAFVPDESFFGGWRILAGANHDQMILNREIVVPVNDALNLSAQFSDTGRLIAIVSNREDAVLIPSSGEYWVANETEIDLQAVAPEGLHFHHWHVLPFDDQIETAATRVKVTHNATYMAIFGPPLFALSLETQGEGGGHVDASVRNNTRIPAGTRVELRALPKPDAVFARWEGDLPGEVDAENPHLILVMAKNSRIAAVFDAADFQLEISIDGPEDSVREHLAPRPGLYGFRANTETTIRAYPPKDSALAFAGWAGDTETLNPEHRLVMDRDRHVVARFVDADQTDATTLTIVPPEGAGRGTIGPLAPGRYHFVRNAVVSLSIGMETGYYFGGWTGDYEGEITHYGLPVLLDRDKSLGARFSTQGTTVMLYLDGEEGGHITPPSGLYQLASGMEITLTAERTDTEWSFVGWFDTGGVRLSSHARYTFTVPADAGVMHIIAMFREYIEPPRLVLCGTSDPYSLYVAVP